MIKKVSLTKENRISAITNPPYSGGPDEFEFEFPEDFNFERAMDWKIVKKELIYDPLPEPEPPINVLQRMEEYEAAILELAEMITGGDM